MEQLAFTCISLFTVACALCVVLSKNAVNAAKVVKATVEAMPKVRSCKCGSALAHAIMTDRTKIPAATKEKLALIVGKYFK